MDTSTWIFLIVMGFVILVYGLITYFFAVKKNYFLLNGYESRPEEEKEYLQQSGYLKANGRLLIISFWVLCVPFILGLIDIPFGFEIGMALFVIILLGGLFWVQRYEVPKKRKRMRWITGLLTVSIIGFIVWIALEGFNDNSFVVTEESFEVIGSYEVTWDTDTIQDVELLDELPDIRIKTNGTNLGGLLKGKFRLEEPYGSGRLYIEDTYKTTKVLYVQTIDDFMMISRNTDAETIELYEELQDALE